MTKKKADASKPDERDERIAELTADLQRVQADFQNYQKRAEIEKQQARAAGRNAAILKLLPTIDNIERAIAHVPEDLADNTWAKGVTGLMKGLETSLKALDVTRIDATAGTPFDHDVHEAIGFDEDAEGEHEVVAEELQAGYRLGDDILRHSLVRVTRK
ncbi:MAG TPA: nucleotide exchange factor GrpE [Candidatus Saccharimonadales bacterium]|jgi:molecular chaperone GrpE